MLVLGTEVENINADPGNGNANGAENGNKNGWENGVGNPHK